MSGYRTWLIEPPDYPHIGALTDLRDGLDGALQELGVYDRGGRQIVLGAHLPGIGAISGAIIFNTEVHGSPWFTPAYLDLLRQREVWDYSLDNVHWLIGQGIHARHCPIGYHESLTRIEPATEQDIDVLFYGSMTPRRIPIWEAVSAIEPKLNIVHLFGIYGVQRDAFIARSKIVLDLKAYEQSPRNDARLSYLWANKALAVPEHRYVTEDMPKVCRFWASQKEELRQAVANDDHEAFKAKRQANYLRPLLGGYRHQTYGRSSKTGLGVLT